MHNCFFNHLYIRERSAFFSSYNKLEDFFFAFYDPKSPFLSSRMTEKIDNVKFVLESFVEIVQQFVCLFW